MTQDKIKPYRLDLIIDNTGQLPPGKGARYLEVFDSHHSEPRAIAVQWRRKPPAELQPGRYLLDFKPD